MNYDALLQSIQQTHTEAKSAAAGAVNRQLVCRNWLIGAYLVEFEQNGEDRAAYGSQLLKRLAKDLNTQKIPGTSADMLERMRALYLHYPQIADSISAPAVRKLSRTRRIASETDKLALSAEVSNDSQPSPLPPVKLQLGSGFCFEARQKRVTVGNEHDYIDLVFYHRILRCHLLIDLKTRKFDHRDSGQINFYLNYWKDQMMAEGDNPPVGLILCTDSDQTKVQYATSGIDHQLFVSRYLIALPKPEELEALIEDDRAVFEEQAAYNRQTSAWSQR